METKLLIVLLVLTIVTLGACTSDTDSLPEKVEPAAVERETAVIETEVTEEQVNESLEEEIMEPDSDETVPVEVMKEEDSLERTECTRAFSPKLSKGPYYDGPLFDAHFHMPNLIDFSKIEAGPSHGSDSVMDPVIGKDVMLDKILCIFDKERVRGAIAFAIGTELALDETLSAAESIIEESSGKIRLFLMPSQFNIEGLESIENSHKGLFSGYGEMAFYVQDYANTPPDATEVLEIYQVAGNNGLIVMMHPDGGQEKQIENAVRKNPNVKFLLHGPEIERSITNLIAKNPNVYYSVDAILIRAPRSPGGLIYISNTKENLESTFTQNYDSLLNRAVNDWKSKIEQHPDRFMWGTDRAYKWHYDEEVSVLLEEFARAFIAKLDPEVQEKFAYKNAEKLLQQQ